MDPEIPEERPKAAALQLELPTSMPPRAAAAVDLPARRESFPARARRRAVPIAITAVVLAIGAGVAIEILMPRYVRRACIDAAAAHGIGLAIDDVTLSGAGFVLKGVKATAADLPGASVEAPEIVVETQDLKPEKLTASAMEVELSGRWSNVSAAFDRWRASDRGGQDGAWVPASVVIDGSRIVWHAPLGDQANLEASGVHLDVAWRGREPTMHASSSRVSVTIPSGALGPWRVDLDRDPGTSRARIALDPAVPDASTILLVGTDDAITSAEISIPRSPIARLGVAPALLGLHGDPQLETAIRYSPLGSQGSATAKGGLHGIVVSGIPQPIDISWDIAAAGPSGAMDVKNGRVAVGPLVGNTRGTLKTYPDGFHVDLGWSAGPVPCAAFDAPLAPGQPFDIAYQLRKLAENAGLTSLTGTVSAIATLTFDSRELGATTIAFTPKATCDVAIGL